MLKFQQVGNIFKVYKTV